jgi:hypothetical protein
MGERTVENILAMDAEKNEVAESLIGGTGKDLVRVRERFG